MGRPEQKRIPLGVDAQKPIPRKCWFMMTGSGRTIQWDLAPGHQGAHEIPSA